MRFRLFLLVLGCPFWVHANCDSSRGYSSTGVSAQTSIYYTPTMTTERVTCGNQVLNAIVDSRGRTIRDCATIRARLNEQGAGVVRDSRGRFEAAYVYSAGNLTPTRSTQCPIGYGARSNICLNPFKTIAAHLGAGYKLGDVLYVPKTVGMRYPEYPGQPAEAWATHDGHWIIGDVGGKIKGRGRFDFFSGTMDWRDPQNPLSRLGFGDAKNIPFCKVNETRSRQVHAQTGYPGLSETQRVALLDPQAVRTPSPVQMAEAAIEPQPQSPRELPSGGYEIPISFEDPIVL